MTRRLNRAAGAILVAAAAACGGDAHSQAVVDSGVPIVEQVGINPKLGEQLPLDGEFVDSHGQRMRLRDCFDGRPVILHLVYYACPMLCKLSADGLFRTLPTLSLRPGEDFTVVTISFDPRETPELSALAREMAVERCGGEAVERGWHFLTGNEREIADVTETVGFRYAFDEATGQFAHAAGLFVLTPEGIVSRYLSGIEYSPRDLRLAVVEASNGKVGTMGDQMMLLCYMYNPATGKYGLAIMTALRAAGIVTIASMAAGIFTMIRREQRNYKDEASPPIS